MKTITVPIIITILTSFIPVVSNASTQVYDLTADWSATSNPNGQWSWGGHIYKNNEGSMVVGLPQPPGSEWGGPFFAWVVWTAPESGTIDISGAMWDLYEGQLFSADWSLFYNGSLLRYGYAYADATPISFYDPLFGPEILQNIPVAAGDHLTLEIYAFHSGVEFTIAFTPSPGDPILALEELQAAVIEMNLQNGIENSLDNKLDAALNALDDLNANNDAAACNSLDAFVNSVEAQRGTQITDAQADQLIASAQEIQVLLNCGG